MLRRIGAVLAGIVAAFVVVAIVEMVGHSVYGAPDPGVIENPELMKEYVAGLPTGALLFVLAAWYLGTFAGGITACMIARAKPVFHASIIGVFLLAATAVNLITIPHPAWFAVVGLVGIIVVGAVTGRIGGRFVAIENPAG